MTEDKKDSQNLAESLGHLSDKPLLVYILGGPGSGKGTLCGRLTKEHDVVHVSAGDLLREEKEKNEERRPMIEECMRNGNIVPTHVTVDLLRAFIEAQRPRNGTVFLIDGFPRHVQQALESDGVVCIFQLLLHCGVPDEAQLGQIALVLYFKCTKDTMLRRALRRGETSGRIDDNANTFQKRMVGFERDTLPVIDFFERRGLLATIDCEIPLDESYPALKAVIADKLSLKTSKELLQA